MPLLADAVRRHRREEATALDVLALVGGDAVGCGSASEPADRRESPSGWSWIGVPAEHRGRGVGSAIRNVLSEHLRTLGKSQTDGWVWDDDAAAVEWLTRRGFETVERFQYVRLDLARVDPAVVDPPRGVEIVARGERAGLEHGMYDVHREAMADLPTNEPLDVSFDDFRAWEIDHPARRADLSFVALHGDEVIGYATLGVVGEEGDHVLTAVKRTWRRRGVASALKSAQLRAAKAAGVRGIATFNELRNDAMRALNEQLGYEHVANQLRVRGPLG